MTKKQAKAKWFLTDREVDGICEYYGFTRVNGQFQIPEDTIPVYIPDKRYMKNGLRLYLFVSDAIHKKLLLVPELINTSDDEIRTIVRILRDRGLIERIEGRPKGSLNYQDYILGIEFADWKRDATDNFKLLNEILGTVVESGSKGVTSAILEHYSM